MKKILLLITVASFLFANVNELSLDEAIKIALQNNKQTKISKVALEIAQVQYEQALSANYPAINAMVVGQRLKEDGLYRMELPSQFTLAIASIGLNSTDSQTQIQNLVQNGMTQTDATSYVLNQIAGNYKILDTKTIGRDTVKGSLSILYPLFTGGKISSIIEQANLNKLLAMNTIKRSEEDVIFDVKKYFYGYVLTNELHKIANSTYKRMQFISDLTKQFYENGNSLNIKKTDYLQVQVTLSLIESIVSKLQSNKLLVQSALANAIGLPWDSKIEVLYEDESLVPKDYLLDDLVKQAYRTNSDITKLDIALKIANEQVKEAKSGHYPKLALMGEVSHTYNSYEYGFLSENQQNSWNIGFALDIPLFDGFKTTNSVNEKKLEKKKMFLLQDMLKEGVALQIKNELIKASIGFKQMETLNNTKQIAKENRDLNIKGYQIEAIEPEKVIQAQYIEAYVQADYLKYKHDYLMSLATLHKLIGEELKH